MKNIIILLAFVSMMSTQVHSQSFVNSDLEGTIDTSSPTFPISDQLPGWQNVDGADPVCTANTFASASPDVNGSPTFIPFSGQTFVTGLFGEFIYPNSFQIFDEGIMQTVTGFTPGSTYNIHLYQTVIPINWGPAGPQASKGCFDNSGSWEVFAENTSLGVTVPTINLQPFGSDILDWEERIITFSATTNSHDIKFLPRDDDNNSTLITGSASVSPNECIQMAIDSIWIELTMPAAVNFELQLSDITICENDCVDILPSFINNSGDVSLSWDNGINFAPIFTNTVCPTSTTTFTVIGMDSSGNTDTVTVQVTVNPSPIPNLGTDFIFCNNTLLDVTTQSASYNWQDNSTSSTFNVSQAGIYWVDVTLNGCTVRDSIEIISNPSMLNGGGDFVVCEGESIILQASGLDNVTYNWDNGIQDNIPFVINMTKQFSVSATDVNGCIVSDVVNVTVNPLPVINAGQDIAVCENEIITLNGSGAGLNGTYVWGSNIQNNSPFSSFSGNFIVTGTDQNGCSMTDNINVSILNLPTVSILNNPIIECAPLTLELESQSQNTTIYEWQISDGTTLSGSNPTYMSSNEGCYDVLLIGTSVNGCKDSINIQNLICIDNNNCPEVVSVILPSNEIEEVEELLFYVPNAFTPDGDEYNQIFQPIFTSGFDPYDFKLLIFNRWGEIVFESNDASIGWDGAYGGSNVHDGVYAWRIEFGVPNNDYREVVVGSVVLLR